MFDVLGVSKKAEDLLLKNQNNPEGIYDDKLFPFFKIFRIINQQLEFVSFF